MKVVFFVFVIIVSLSCNNQKQVENPSAQLKVENIDSSFNSMFTSNDLNKDDVKAENQDTITVFEFKDLKVSVNRLVTYEEDSIKSKSISSDTVYFSIDIEESIEGQKILLESSTLENLKAEMSYQTSVSIQNEGPHCDLTNWKHYSSPLKELVKISQNEFLTNKIEEKDRLKFVNISIAELKSEVKKECGEDWYNLVQKVKTPNDYPSSVTISRYILRLSGTEKKNGKTIVKIIIIESPMGC